MSTPIQTPDLAQGLRDFTDTRAQLSLMLGDTVLPVIVVGTLGGERGTLREAHGHIFQGAGGAGTWAMIHWEAAPGTQLLVRRLIIRSEVASDVVYSAFGYAAFAGASYSVTRYKRELAQTASGGLTRTLGRSGVPGVAPTATDFARRTTLVAGTPFIDDLAGFPILIDAPGQVVVHQNTANAGLMVTMDFAELVP